MLKIHEGIGEADVPKCLESPKGIPPPTRFFDAVTRVKKTRVEKKRRAGSLCMLQREHALTRHVFDARHFGATLWIETRAISLIFDA